MKPNQNISEPEAELELVKASDITPKKVEWLWYPYISFGKVTLVQGDPGDGKSQLMLALFAIASKGKSLPFANEEDAHDPMTVIYQTTEGDADDTVSLGYKDGQQIVKCMTWTPEEGVVL